MSPLHQAVQSPLQCHSTPPFSPWVLPVALPSTIAFTLARAGIANSYHYTGLLPRDRPASDFSLRVIPAHSQVQVPNENPLIYWQQ